MVITPTIVVVTGTALFSAKRIIQFKSSHHGSELSYTPFEVASLLLMSTSLSESTLPITSLYSIVDHNRRLGARHNGTMR